MKIPKQFIIHGHVIKVIQKEIDNSEDNRFGCYDSVKEEIVIFRKVRSGDDAISLTDVQLEATFFHELVHSFQWHIKGETNETEAQSYAGLLIEFIRTSNIKIDPNVIHEPFITNEES